MIQFNLPGSASLRKNGMHFARTHILPSTDRLSHRSYVASIDMSATPIVAQSCEELDPLLARRFAELVSTDPQPQIILGTQSRSRRAVVDELSQAFGFKASSITADIDEKAIRRPDPYDLVLALAHAKADAIIKKLKDAESLIRPGFLVTCDQVVVHEGEIREKPESEGEARHFIRSSAAIPVSTFGASVCTCLDTGERVQEVEHCVVHMLEPSSTDIDYLIHEGTVFECAGGLMIEHPRIQPYVTNIEGTVEGVMGLSKNAFMRVVVRSAQHSSSSKPLS